MTRPTGPGIGWWTLFDRDPPARWPRCVPAVCRTPDQLDLPHRPINVALRTAETLLGQPRRYARLAVRDATQRSRTDALAVIHRLVAAGWSLTALATLERPALFALVEADVRAARPRRPR